MRENVTLHEGVRELVDRGLEHPATILSTLVEQYGEVWLRRQLLSIVAGMTQRSPSVYRARGQMVRREGLPRVQKVAGDILERMVWVDGDWKALGELTSSDCRTVAAQYSRLMEAAGLHRDWFLDAALVIESGGGEVLADVRGQLRAPLSPLALPSAGDAA